MRGAATMIITRHNAAQMAFWGMCPKIFGLESLRPCSWRIKERSRGTRVLMSWMRYNPVVGIEAVLRP